MTATSPRRRRWPLRRFRVADRSMQPALQPGDGLVATPCGPARAGQIRCFRDPRVPQRWLVKRVARVEGATMQVRSDNRSVATSDSALFGPVPVRGSYRVLLRVPARWM